MTQLQMVSEYLSLLLLQQLADASIHVVASVFDHATSVVGSVVDVATSVADSVLASATGKNQYTIDLAWSLTDRPPCD